MNNFCFEHLWTDSCKTFFSQSSEELPTGIGKNIFLLCVLICTPILLHKCKAKATWKHIHKLGRRKLLCHYRGIFLLIICFPSVHILGWVEKVPLCCTVHLIHREYYQHMQGNRDYISNSSRNYLPVLLHQCIMIPRRSKKVIFFPRKKGKILA